jgi:transcriptional regulator PpsR
VSIFADELAQELAGRKTCIGKPWSRVVTVESRPKVEAMLAEASTNAASSWRQISHPAAGGGPDIPILYSVIQAGRPGVLVAVGRDLRPVAQLQQKLVQAQASLERDYSRLRHVEMRYRLLFELSAEPIMIVNAGSLKVLEVNPAVHALFGEAAKRLSGHGVLDVFTDAGGVRSLLAAVRASGRPDSVQAHLQRPDREVQVSASLFRQDGSELFLVRFSSFGAAQQTSFSKLKSKMLKIVENAPDGFVMTDPDGRILKANQAFLEMANLQSEEQARGEALDRWIGRPGVDLQVLIANLRQSGTVRLFGTTLNLDYGPRLEIEASAVAVMNGGKPCYGFTLRNIGRRILDQSSRAGPALPSSPEQVTDLIGRMSLKDVVRETTDVIERLCIETALELTGDNRASAAELLGLSRQSLYVKLRRYGLDDDAADSNGSR